jgi:hypothetical protein
MKTATKNLAEFYQVLGKVFYSLASIDHKIHEKEISKLQEVVKREWLPFEHSDKLYGSDVSNQIETVFLWLHENDWSNTNFLSEFKTFKNKNPSLFPKEIAFLIFKTGAAIGNSFSGMNKSELDYLYKINQIVNE